MGPWAPRETLARNRTGMAAVCPKAIGCSGTSMSRHKAAWWAKRVEELARGGNAEEIAQRYGVRPRTLVWWRSELTRRARSAAEPGPRLLPVVVERSPRRESREDIREGALEVVVELGAARVTARGAVSPEHLAAIISATRAC